MDRQTHTSRTSLPSSPRTSQPRHEPTVLTEPLLPAAAHDPAPQDPPWRGGCRGGTGPSLRGKEGAPAPWCQAMGGWQRLWGPESGLQHARLWVSSSCTTRGRGPCHRAIAVQRCGE